MKQCFKKTIIYIFVPTIYIFVQTISGIATDGPLVCARERVSTCRISISIKRIVSRSSSQDNNCDGYSIKNNKKQKIEYKIE